MSEDSCRVCLKSKSKDLKTSIFDNSDDNLTIADKIIMCGDVKISHDQNLPNKICKKCLNALEIAYNFRKSCKKTDNILQIIMNTNNRNNVIVSLNNGKTYKLPQDIKIKVIKKEEIKKDIENQIFETPFACALNESKKSTKNIEKNLAENEITKVNVEDEFYSEYLEEDAEIYSLDIAPIQNDDNNHDENIEKIYHLQNKK